MKRILIFLLIFLALSCKTNSIDKPERPDNLISKNEMVEIIYDMSIISSAKGVNKKILESKGVVPEDYVFNKHNIDSLQFALSNEYYAYNLRVYEDIYNKVRIKLNSDKTHFNTIFEAEQKVKDSINKAKRKELDSINKNRQPSEIKRIKAGSNDVQGHLKKIDTSQISTHQ
jgi:hypothetical protein